MGLGLAQRVKTRRNLSDSDVQELIDSGYVTEKKKGVYSKRNCTTT